MSPKEKAESLMTKFSRKEALICVEEIIDELQLYLNEGACIFEYWDEVKEELLKADVYSKDDMVSFATFYYAYQGRTTYLGKDLFKVWKEKQNETDN